MAGHWYCKIDGQTSGPLGPQQLKALAKSEELGPNDLVRHGDEGPWVPAICVKGLLAPGDSEATLPEPTGATAAETARRGPGKYASKTDPKPKPKPAARRKSRTLPTAKPVDEPAAAKPKSAAPRPAPARQRAAAASTDTPDPLSFAPPPESATHRALGRSAGTPRNRQRNNMVVIVTLLLATVGIAIGGVLVVMNRDAIVGDSESAKADEPLADAPSKPTPVKKVNWVPAAKPAAAGDAQLRILSAEIGKPPGTVSSRIPDSLIIKVEVRNTNAQNGLKFVPWSDAASKDQPIRLVDDRDKSYRPRVVRSGGPDKGLQPGKVNEVPAAELRERIGQSEGVLLLSFTSPAEKVAQHFPAQVQALAMFNASKLKVIQVNVDDDRSLLDEYKVTGVPTLLLLNKGRLVDTFKGETSRAIIQQAIDYEAGPSTPENQLAASATAEDVLLFEPPAASVKHLHLTLPAVAVGAEGMVGFEIPYEMIAIAEPPKPSRPPQQPRPTEQEPAPTEPKPASTPDSKPEEGDGESPFKPVEPEEPMEPVDQGEKEFEELRKELDDGDDGPMGLDNDATDFTKKPGMPMPGEGDKKEPKQGDRTKNGR